MTQQIRCRDQADRTSANDEHSVMHADALGLRTRKSSQWITRKYYRQASKAAAFGAPIHTATIERVMSSDLAQRLDRCDVLTDEPRDICRMGRDHEMTRALNGRQR